MESFGMLRSVSLSSSSYSFSFTPIPPSSFSIYNNRNRKKPNSLIYSSSISSTSLKEEEEEDVNTKGVNFNGDLLTARERRQLRNEKREMKALSGSTNWREEVEERLLKKKPKKRYASWTEELNLDNLSLLGSQWWVVRVSRASGQDSSETIARSLARNFPDIEFKVYAPAIRVKRKLKNGTISVKPKPVFPGCVFLRCVLNKEIHDIIRECVGVAGFVGSKVGNTKRQINRPKPVSSHDMDAIFRQAKEEQEKTDQAFEEELQGDQVTNEGEMNANLKDDIQADAKPRRRSKKGSKPLGGSPSPIENDKLLIPGSSIRVVSGPFMEFTGILKKLDRKTGKGTVGFILFGKESLVKLDIDQLALDTRQTEPV